MQNLILGILGDLNMILKSVSYVCVTFAMMTNAQLGENNAHIFGSISFLDKLLILVSKTIYRVSNRDGGRIGINMGSEKHLDNQTSYIWHWVSPEFSS